MLADFKIAVDKVLKAEGILSRDKNDAGGVTKFGITEKVARDHGYTGAMEDLTIDFALKIYEDDYWLMINLDKMDDQDVANTIFSISVNSGQNKAGRILQRALNLLNRNATSWRDIIEDGIIGSITLGLFNELSAEDKQYVYWVCLGLMFFNYNNITLHNTTQEDFIRGWVNRIRGLM